MRIDPQYHILMTTRAVDPSDLATLLILSTASAACAILWVRCHGRAARSVWTVALVAVSVPFFDLHAHTHWAKVGWIPFVTPPIKASDIAANIVIYLPFGFLSRRRTNHVRRLLNVVAGAATLSFAMETTQLFSHSRFPSTTDIICDVVGAAAGVALSRLIECRRHAAGP